MASKPQVSIDGEKLQKIEEKIRLYAPGFDMNEVREALELVKPVKKTKTQKGTAAVNDLFYSDPLRILENLIEYANPDRETILSAILYPSMRPLSKHGGPNIARLNFLEGKFGIGVRSIIEDTLRFRASKYVEPVFHLPAPLKDKEEQAKEKKKLRDAHLAQFKLMMLVLTRGKPAILEYTTQILLNLQSELETPGTFKPEKLAYMIQFAEDVAAPLAYIAGFEKLRENLLDTCFKIKEPTAYKEVRRQVDSVIRNKETAAVKQAIIDKIEKTHGWKAGVHFDVEIRPKPAYSTYAKAQRKGQEIKQLGDLCGMRVILNKSVVQGGADLDLRTLKKIEKNKLHKALGEKDKLVYGTLSQAFGWGNFRKTDRRPVLDENQKPLVVKGVPQIEWYSYTQERFAELAVQEPRALDPGRYDDDPERKQWEEKKYPNRKDARFDDYIDRPKPNLYSGMQDTLLVTIPGRDKPVEFECQIVDEMRHDFNMKGPGVGRVYYKSGMQKLTGAIQRWYSLSDMPHDKKHRHRGHGVVLVIDAETKKVVDISNDATVSGFFKATGREMTAVEAQVYNGYEFPANDSHPDRRKTCGKSTTLISGCSVLALAA